MQFIVYCQDNSKKAIPLVSFAIALPPSQKRSPFHIPKKAIALFNSV
ncbi:MULTISPECIES: hypothetical protein [Aphanizomenonaceae]|nr:MULTISPECIES: hypothetical protein [Aphanizomenonaceae]MBE9251732.1 hypothetical protein [Dolichospermum sp. LEGE 00240]QSV71354.1 MAG: hypothetical protein HEQ20_11990 [Aphanizomenon flos-aquae KM1D3_PB]